MFPDVGEIGEQTLNKIAEMALRTQLDAADRLEVRVKTDPGLLAQGKLETLIIDGEGLVMQKDLRMQVLEIDLRNIAVEPLLALAGNIELTEPSDGKARVILTEADINRAFNCEILNPQMRNLTIHQDEEAVIVDVERVACQLLPAGKVAIDATICFQQTGETRQVAFNTTPRISSGGRGVVLEDVDYAQGKELSPELTQALVEEAKAILNLENFEMEGIALEIRELKVESDKLILQAIAHITQFPST